MLPNESIRFSEFLTKVAATLDIPDYVYEDATVKYEDIGSWLAAEDSDLKLYSPEIYPQGSFRLGTTVRPVSEKDEYDIDLVCHLELQKEQVTQKELKQKVGDRLKQREDLAKMLQPSRRCWTLDYPLEEQKPHFHMDVLPAIPNQERLPTGILITDKELFRWQKSNPKAYAEWFFGRMQVRLLEMKSALAESFQANVEDVPDWQVKTPLQIAIQILKRHRDFHFQNDLDNKPVSIIITTLAAHAYNNQHDVYDALINIVKGMPDFIEKRNGEWWVENPVDPEENFADKWNEYPKRKDAFLLWLQKIQDDFTRASKAQSLGEAAELLSPAFGGHPVLTAVSALGLKPSREMSMPATPQIHVPDLGDTQHCQSLAWPLQEKYRARISGSVYPKKTAKNHWLLTDRPVPKKVWLRFKVSTNTPPSYNVQWQVVNTGKEAADAQQLRGDFYESDEPSTNIRWESTAYKGTHWVEAFVIKNGVCVAKSGRKIVKVS